MMTSQELLPNSTNLFLRKYFYAERIPDREINNIEMKITKKIIVPITSSKSKEGIIQESDIQQFMKSCKEMTDIFYQKQGFKKAIKLDLDVYGSCLIKIDQAGLSDENKSMIHYLLDSLKDYTLNIRQISKREDELKHISEKLDYEDFKRSLYGSLLAFVCIMVGIVQPPAIKIKTNVLTSLINEGYNFATELDSYTDTLDILTNQKELELLKKSELG